MHSSPIISVDRETGNCMKCCAEFQRRGAVCQHCRLNLTIEDYGRSIFSYRRTVHHQVTHSAGGRLGDQETEELQSQVHEQHRVGKIIVHWYSSIPTQELRHSFFAALVLDGVAIMLNKTIMKILSQKRTSFEEVFDVDEVLQVAKKTVKFFDFFQREYMEFGKVNDCNLPRAPVLLNPKLVFFNISSYMVRCGSGIWSCCSCTTKSARSASIQHLDRRCE